MKPEPFLSSSASALLKKLEPYNPDKPKILRSPAKKRISAPVRKLVTSLVLIGCIGKLQDKNTEYYDQVELPEDLLNNVKDIVYEFNDLSDEIGTERLVKKLQQWEYFSNSTYHVLSEFEWRAKEIKKGRGTYIKTEEARFFAGLKFHYVDLPSCIRPCFVYCSIYPKGQNMVRETLINLWMAEGFLWSPSSSHIEDLEDIGNRYFNELLWRGLFEEPTFAFGSKHEEKEEDQVIYDCKVPNNMHFFVSKIGGAEVFNVFGEQKCSSQLEGLESSRRFALNKDSLIEEGFLKKHWNDRRVRTCMLFGLKRQVGDSFLEEITWRFDKILVLDLSGTEFKELPRSTRRLKQLRYLSLSRNGIIEALSFRLYELKYLQTLVLDGCHRLQELPRHTSDLIRLRNLYLTSKDTILSEVILSGWTSLRILELSHCKRLTALSSEGVKNLLNLRKLRIYDCPRLVSLPDNMKFLTRIEELVLHNCPQLDLTESEAMDKLLNLRSLEIIGLAKLVELPVGLQSAINLRHFFIANCRNLRDFAGVLSYQTSLRRLCIYDCSNLVALPEGLSVHLQLIDIRGCSELSKKFDSEDEWRLVSHIPEIILDGQCIQKNCKSSVEIEAAFRASSSRNEAPEALKLPRIIPFFNLKLQTFGMVEDIKEKSIEVERRLLEQEPQFGTSIKSQVRDLFARMKNSILAKDYEDQLIIKSSETEDSMNLPPTQSTNHDQVEAKLLCSLFPKDHEFERETLIQLWMAGGYLNNEPLEDQGDQLFNMLLSERCILESRIDTLTQKTKYKSNVGDISTIVSESYTKVRDKRQMFDHISKNSLHMALMCDDIGEKDFEELKKFNELRTLLFLRNYGSHIKQIPFDLFLSLRCLHALDLSGIHITELPSSIGNVKILRYLDLSKTLIRSLPETIDRLQNLQTLKLKECAHLFELPRGITKLTLLRHLEYDVLGQLTVMPRGIGGLSALRTLSAFIVDGKEGFSNIEELKFLNNLTGSFCISGLEHIEDPEDAKKAALSDKKHLTQLELRWSDIVQDWTHNEAKVLAHLEPSTALEELQILCFPGVSFPSWVSHPSYEKLVSITFLKCKNLILPPLGKLPELKYLEIIESNNVAKIDRDFCGGTMQVAAFPKLEKLTIDGMFILEIWEGVNDGDFPHLSELSVKFCPNLSTLPMLPQLPPLKYLELSSCTSLKSLPDGRCLISLETLLIEDCPLIEKMCSKEGDYWHKIKHVLDIWVDGLQECVTLNEDDNIGTTEKVAEDKKKLDKDV